jgi:hypothetical protein
MRTILQLLNISVGFYINSCFSPEYIFIYHKPWNASNVKSVTIIFKKKKKYHFCINVVVVFGKDTTEKGLILET